jgi:hypothetical protein
MEFDGLYDRTYYLYEYEILKQVILIWGAVLNIGYIYTD